MDKKNSNGKVDSVKASAMIENLRKKLNSSSRDVGESDKRGNSAPAPSVPADVEIRDTRETVSVAPPEAKNETVVAVEKTEKEIKSGGFDGILYKGGSKTEAKPKKKYNSYRSDEPLFFFDSFEDDDEFVTGEASAVPAVEEVPEAEEIEEAPEAEESEEASEAEEIEEASEAEEIEEAPEAEGIEEVPEAEEIEEVPEAEEIEEAPEVEEVEEAPEAEEVEEASEVEEIEEAPEAKEIEEASEAEEIEEATKVETERDIADTAGLAVYGEYRTVEIINDGEFKVIKAVDKNGDYKIVIVNVEEDGQYEIIDVFDMEDGESDDGIALAEDISGQESMEVGLGETEASDGERDEDILTVAEEVAEDTPDAFGAMGERTIDGGFTEFLPDAEPDEVAIFGEEESDGGISLPDESESCVAEAETELGTASEDGDGGEEPIVATEIEEAVSIAEEYTVGNRLQDKYKNLFSADDGLFEEVDEPLTVATEIEDISLATEITSNIVLPGEADEGDDEEPEIDPESPDWVQDESFLRECAQLELPKLLTPMRDINSEDDGQFSGFVTSGYKYAELPALDAYIMEKSRRKREAAQSKEQRSEGAANEPARSDEELRAEFYEKRANAYRTQCAGKARDAMKSVIYTAILAIVVLFLENIGRITNAPIIGAERAILMLAFDIALVFVGGVIVRDTLKESVGALLKLRYNCESVGAFALLLTVIYGIFAIVTYSGDGAIPFIGAPMVCCLLYSATLRYIAVKRDETLFDASCDEGTYCSLAELERNSAVPEFKELQGIVGENAGIYRPNYPKRTEKGYLLNGESVNVGAFGVIITAIAFLISAAAGVLSYFVCGSDPATAFATAITALIFSLPVFLSVSVFAENSSLVKRSAQRGALILDGSVVNTVKNGAVLLLDDTDLYRVGDVKIVGFDINGADKDDRAVEMALGRISGVIQSVGGALSELFAQLGDGASPTADVELTDISEKGISAYCDGYCIRIGSASYLGRYGITINADVSERADGEKMLYAAENGVLCLRMTLSYTADKALCKRIEQLRGYGVAVSLKTCDPCIDTELVMRTTGIEPELLRVVKYAIDDPRESEEGERDGGIVSTRGVEGLISALGNCARHGISLKRLKAVSAVLSLAVPIALAVSAAMAVPFTAIPLWTVSAYYGGSALLGWLLAKIL